MKSSASLLAALSSLLAGGSRYYGAPLVFVRAEEGVLTTVMVPDLQPVNYTDPFDGAELMGYLALPPLPPDDTSSASTPPPPKGYVVIFPDWDGVNEYEQIRASLLAEGWGYVGFAADVYGSENRNPETFQERGELATRYRENVALANARIAAAIGVVEGLEGYGGEGVAVMGYCFGGSIVLNHALSGASDAVATIAYHGSISAVTKDFNRTVNTKVAIFSGGQDTQDSTASVVEMEGALNAGGNTWEIDRYSDVEHSFTKFDGDAYNAYVDERSWESTKRFLDEVFGHIDLIADVPTEAEAVAAGEDVSYSDPADGASLDGWVAVPPDLAEGQRVPAVVIVHDASGVDLYERTRAAMLADMGYVGFAADVFGPDRDMYDATNRTQRSALLDSFRDDVPFFVRRIRAGVDAAKSHPNADPARIALIGYCFGGTGVIDYAITGQTDAAAVVSFHGGLTKVPFDQSSVPAIAARINVQSGGEDDAASSVEDLEEAMENGNATWEYARYSGVDHGFTNWNDARGRYSPRADVRSWESMRGFLAKAFADVDGDKADGAAGPDVPAVVTPSNGTADDPVAVAADDGTMAPTARPNVAPAAPPVAQPVGAPAGSDAPTAVPTAAPSGAASVRVGRDGGSAVLLGVVAGAAMALL